MNQSVVTTASATHVVNESKRTTALARGAEMTSLKSNRIGAWDAPSTNLKFSAHTEEVAVNGEEN